MAKKEKKEQEPQYYMSAMNTPTYNYNVYYMKPIEKILYFLLAFTVGAAVGYLFYGGIGKDEFGDPTRMTWICNIVVMAVVGGITGRIFIPIRGNQILNKKKKQLRKQFIDLLDSLSTSIAAGKNVPSAFLAAKDDLLIQYSEDAMIIQETQLVLFGIDNNISVESILLDFGIRSGIPDIYNFGKVFETAYSKGGNLKDIIRNCHEILSTKCQIEMEIETKVASNKNEQTIMCFMPIVIIGMIKATGSDFADNFVTPTGIISTTIAIIMFVAAYFVGRNIMKIEV